jgi:uncharacterized membrane protein YdjX (TVP38/TMEM64 family)
MGLTSMPLRPYLLTTFIGILPSCFLYVIVGTQIRRIHSPEQIVSWELLAILTLLAIMPWILHRLVRAARCPRSPCEAPVVPVNLEENA